MKKILWKGGFSLILSLSLMALLNLPVYAAPNLINYQGSLTDSGGTPVTDPSASMTFRIYDAVTGGTPLWEETQTVSVTNGIYNVLLGNGTINPSYGTFDPALFSANNRWLEFEVNGELLTPRQRITSVAWSLQAGEAVHAAAADDTARLGGQSPSAFDQSAHVADTTNPHYVTAFQAGADALGAAATVQGNLDTHAANPSAHHVKTTSFTELTDQAADAQIPASITRDTELAALQTTVTTLQSTVSAQASQIAALQDLLHHVSRTGNDVYISGANLHIVNGQGSTETADGLGNLIVGYNELRGVGDDRSGSHNIVVGSRQNFSSYGGLAAGSWNTISGSYASVSGGYNNTASGWYASVSGGVSNTASYYYASVGGGSNNAASGYAASVSGGQSNTASGDYASVSGGSGNTAGGSNASVSGGASGTASALSTSICGGWQNIASGSYATVSAGRQNTASGESSSVVGGASGEAQGLYASVSGGQHNTASGAAASVAGGGGPNVIDGNIAFADYSAILGGLNNLAGDGSGIWVAGAGRTVLTAGTDHNIGLQSTVSGGAINTADGASATVSGGSNNKALGNSATVSGGSNSTALGNSATVSGGSNNTALGNSATVSGGSNNSVSGDFASVSGGHTNIARGDFASISGGDYSAADGDYSSVSGGSNNTAAGNYSSVSGGNSHWVSGYYDWAAGGLFQDY